MGNLLKVLSPSSPPPPGTLQRILTSQLTPGMFLVRVLDSWWKSPFFVHRRLLNTSSEVEQLMRSGIREVEIDTFLGVEVSSKIQSNSSEISAVETEIRFFSCEQEHADADPKPPLSVRQPSSLNPESLTEDKKNSQEVLQLREAVVAAVEGAFEGIKTGQPLSQPALHGAAQALLQKVVSYPALVAEILLIDSLKQCHRTLYRHSVDTATYSILLGFQLGWDEATLERVGVAGLLHDVGYMRLPQNMVKAHWEGRSDAVLLQKHVMMGEALIKRQAQFSEDIVRMVNEHHTFRDGSGYPGGQGGALLSESGELLGIVDYFDEIITVGGPSRAMPAALALRRLYQEAQKGKFSTPYIEAMIRILGVFPVGTVVQLSTGEQAVVMKQHVEIGLKPHVKIFRGSEGKLLDAPQECDLSKETGLGHEMRITKVLDPTEHPLDLQKYFDL